jgi:hypothetical protein
MFPAIHSGPYAIYSSVNCVVIDLFCDTSQMYKYSATKLNSDSSARTKLPTLLLKVSLYLIHVKK